MIWRRSTETYTSGVWHSGPTIVFAGNKPGQTSGPLYVPPHQWNTIDLVQHGVAVDATYAEGAAFLILTDADPVVNDLTVAVRPPGSPLQPGNYQMQAVTFWAGEGERPAQPWIVPLVDGCFELYWQMISGGAPNAGPTGFLLNMWLTKWGR